MNNERRKQISTLHGRATQLSADRESLRDDIEAVLSDELDYYDEMPEGLQGTARGERTLRAIDALQAAIDALDAMDGDQIANSLDLAKE